MIVFDGISLESVAPVMIEDIRISPVEVNVIERPRAIFPGSEFIRTRYGQRTVAITFGILEDDRAKRESALLRISQWAKTDKEYRLDLPNHPGMYLTAICTGKPEPSYRQWWESKLRLVFTCINDPFWKSIEEKSVACGTAFYALGDAPPLIRIEHTFASAASNKTYSDGTNSIKFSSVPAGAMVIDLNNQTAVVGNASIMSNYKIDSTWIIPKVGQTTISGTGTVKFRERWL